jgi:uncharacterized protein YbbC (DUF1343 family)
VWRGYSGATTFVNHAAVPVRHGMTMGELARLFAAEDATADKLEIVPMRGWRRQEYFDATGLAWVSPSPNLRSVAEVVLYPALGLLEGTNLSVGRGTATPFEHLGAPWIDGDALAQTLSSAKVPGVTFAPTTFTPDASAYRGETCHGVRLEVTDRAAFEPLRTAITIASALFAAYPSTWTLGKMNGILGSQATLDALEQGKPAGDILRLWDPDLDAFRAKRAAYLLY